MRLARVVGNVTLHRKLPELPVGRLLLCEPMDADGVATIAEAGSIDNAPSRRTPTDSALVVLDELGAGMGSVIAISEGREASMPWWPTHAPVDAYCVAMIDKVNVKRELMSK